MNHYSDVGSTRRDQIKKTPPLPPCRADGNPEVTLHMTPVLTPANKKKKEVELKVQVGEPNFKWQMVFNSFWIENASNGLMVKFAYVASGNFDIVSIFVSHEGLFQLKASADAYVREIAGIEPMPPGPIPSGGRSFSPMFSNHVRLARSGGCGEFAFYTIPLNDIANAARGLSKGAPIKPIQVALFHSNVETHHRLVLELINAVK